MQCTPMCSVHHDGLPRCNTGANTLPQRWSLIKQFQAADPIFISKRQPEFPSAFLHPGYFQKVTKGICGILLAGVCRLLTEYVTKPQHKRPPTVGSIRAGTWCTHCAPLLVSFSMDPLETPKASRQRSTQRKTFERISPVILPSLRLARSIVLMPPPVAATDGSSLS